MQTITKETLLTSPTKNFSGMTLINLKLEAVTLKDFDFSDANIYNVDFNQASLINCNFSNVLFKNCTFIDTRLDQINFFEACLRDCNLENAIVTNTNFYCANLEHANLTGIQVDDNSKFFKLHCPEQGAFIGYKKCFNYRIVKLLIPSDAKRSSATNNTCRCDKARVLSITNFDESKSYQEAVSLVDSNFIYRLGESLSANHFDEDRWNDSSYGIHFFMTREEAINY